MNPLVPALRAYFKSIGDDSASFAAVNAETAKIAAKLGYTDLVAVRFENGRAFEVVGQRNGQAEVFDEARWTQATVRQFGLTQPVQTQPTPSAPAPAQRTRVGAPAKAAPPPRPPLGAATNFTPPVPGRVPSAPPAPPASALVKPAAAKPKRSKLKKLRQKMAAVTKKFGKSKARAIPAAALAPRPTYVPPAPPTAACLKAKPPIAKPAAARRTTAPAQAHDLPRANEAAREEAKLQRAMRESVVDAQLDEAIRNLPASSKDFAEYLKIMRHPGSDPLQWGGEAEVAAAAQRYGVLIKVYDQDRADPSRATFGQISDLKPAEDTPVINLLRVGGNHYALLTHTPQTDEFNLDQWKREGKVTSVRGDGNCFFRAVALGLNGLYSQPARFTDHVEVRRRTALYLAQNFNQKISPEIGISYQAMAVDPSRLGIK